MVHSSTGPFFDEDMRKKLVKKLPFTSDELNKLHSFFPEESVEFWRRYFKSEDPKLQKHIKRSGVKEMMKDKKSLNTDDLINFHKSIL